jgi:DHA3 family tetracycline resistance protein-like MFS transporter
MLRALHNRQFAFLWSGQTISRLGDSLYRIALSWWVLEKTGSAVTMGTVNIVSMIPMLLFMLFGGVIVDRLPRPLVMISTDLLRGVLVAAVAILALLNLLQVWEIFVFSALFGTVSAFFEPAYIAIFPEIVTAESLPSANSLTTLSREITGIVGPSIAALIVAAGGTPITFGLDAVSFFVSAVTLIPVLKMSVKAVIPTEKTATLNIWGDLASGFKAVAASPWLWVTISVAALANMMEGGAISTSLPFLIKDVWHMGVESLGFIYSAISVGAVLTAVIMGNWKKLRKRGPVGFLSWFVIGAAILVLGVQKNFVVSLIVAAALGAAATSFGLIWTNSMQEIVPKEMLGRVSSIDYLGSFVLLPIGFAVAGWATDLYGAAMIFIVAGSVIAVLALLALLHPAIRKMD